MVGVHCGVLAGGPHFTPAAQGPALTGDVHVAKVSWGLHTHIIAEEKCGVWGGEWGECGTKGGNEERIQGQREQNSWAFLPN